MGDKIINTVLAGDEWKADFIEWTLTLPMGRMIHHFSLLDGDGDG